MTAVLPGFLTGFSLIVAIGAQNAYILRLGLTRQHVGIAVALCAISDAALIALGIGGVGAVVREFPQVLTAVTGWAWHISPCTRSDQHGVPCDLKYSYPHKFRHAVWPWWWLPLWPSRS